MIQQVANNPMWNFKTLGNLSEKEKAEFYDSIVVDDAKGFLSFGNDTTEYFENPTLRVGILEDDGRIVPASGYTGKPSIKETKINVFLEKYFVFAMPGRQFKLQFAVGTRHLFDSRQDSEEIGHSLAVEGLENEYVNYLGEPVFARLGIDKSFSIDLAVNFIGDKKTDSMLSFMENENVTKGIQLVNNFNPIFGSVLGYVKSISKSILESKKNITITNQHITFVDSPGPAGIPLVEGTYLLTQPKQNETIEYSSLKFDINRGRVLSNNKPFERNHFLLRIEKHI